ncbi:hypothetical protein BCR34DRAFT_566641 [Clohesyomyces aquaticus]|uniref:Uncharacterized protein n=1 Tax=Clohesyomyces aquaticus TaxID=1231657 RepID=A0A1Y1ZJZ0_9PLEO|nr:hypothetical protein BCR34DRAFT_566641 [Clohesyomyces aquaticus]
MSCTGCSTKSTEKVAKQTPPGLYVCAVTGVMHASRPRVWRRVPKNKLESMPLAFDLRKTHRVPRISRCSNVCCGLCKDVGYLMELPDLQYTCTYGSRGRDRSSPRSTRCRDCRDSASPGRGWIRAKGGRSAHCGVPESARHAVRGHPGGAEVRTNEWRPSTM